MSDEPSQKKTADPSRRHRILKERRERHEARDKEKREEKGKSAASYLYTGPHNHSPVRIRRKKREVLQRKENEERPNVSSPDNVESKQTLMN